MRSYKITRTLPCLADPEKIRIIAEVPDGIHEVFVNKNEFASGTLFDRIRVIEKGNFHDLIWEENRLTTNWKTSEIQGYIADFQMKDVDNDGEMELVAAVVTAEEGVSGALTTKTSSHVFFLKLF